jgi:hypothetical protein
LTLCLTRTLDIPRTIALLKPLTGTSDIHPRLVGINEAADTRIVSRSMIDAEEHFIPLWIDHYVAALPPSLNRRIGRWHWSPPALVSQSFRRELRAPIPMSWCARSRLM